MGIRLKTKAFTLAEMIVVMILTTIVAGIAFTVLELVQKQMLGIREQYELKSQWSRLEYALWSDFNRFNDIQYDSTHQRLLLKHNLDSITYEFTRDHIVRSQDTFRINSFEFQFKFKGQLAISKDVDAIKITSRNNSTLSLFVYTVNDATRFMH